MTELVTKAEAYDQLRIDNDSNGSADDGWLDVWIPAVSEAVLGWLKDEWRAYVPELDSNGDPVLDSNEDPVPAEPLVVKWSVKAAVLLELSYQYRYREGEGDHTATGDLYNGRYGYTLSRGATALLTPLRKPTIR